MNKMLVLPIGSNKDESLFLGLFLCKLPTSMGTTANHQTALAMAKHADILWEARCGNSSITAVDAAEVDAINTNRNASNSCHSWNGIVLLTAGAVRAQTVDLLQGRTAAAVTPPSVSTTTSGETRLRSVSASLLGWTEN